MGAPTGQSLGSALEDHACRWLQSQGWRCIDRNWRCRAGEIDLVMLDGEVLVFVEVKARRSRQMGEAEEAITPAKAQRLLATGEWFLSEHPEFADAIWRIDLVALSLGRSGEIERTTRIESVVVSG